jgi:hypothetical protein
MSRRLDTERAKLPNHVGLIGVAMFGGERGPRFRRTHGGSLPQPREADYPDELLWRHADRREKSPLHLP